MSRDLTKGNIKKNLIKLSLPIMGTSFLQMAYNLTDIYWVGHLGESSIASVGTAGYYLWLSFAFVLLIKIGAEVKVAQSLGAKDYKKTNTYADNAIMVGVLIGIFYMLVMVLFRHPLIDFFDVRDVTVAQRSKEYLAIVAFSFPFGFALQVISSIYNASGNSKLPFKINSMGLIVNMILDPLLILYFDFGVIGVAIATTTAQVLVFFVFLYALRVHPPYKGYRFKREIDSSAIKDMVKISYPPALQSGLFTMIAMVVARFVASFGTNALAVQRIGTQLEALTYMTAGGFGVALSSMVGQNYGAKNFDRVKESIKSGVSIMAGFGIFASFVLIFFARGLFSLFVASEEVLEMGVTYLRIIGISQFFMCIEITLGGAFNGLGQTKFPATVSVTLNAIRIPIAYYLAYYTFMALNGIWWAISITSILKGVLLSVLAMTVLRAFIDKESHYI